MKLSYAYLVVLLANIRIDLRWADEQYLCTLFNVIGEYTKLGKKPERKKVGSANIGKFIT